jgi:hypothetical protein
VDVAARFLGYGWNVLRVGDANDCERIENALQTFRETTGRPTFIIIDSHIGYGAPHKQDSAAAHGEPLGEEEIRLTKRSYGWPEDAKFLVPEGVKEHFAAGVGARGSVRCRMWTEMFGVYKLEHPELAAEIERMQRRELPDGWERNLPTFPADAKGLAGREASGKVLNVLAQNIPWFLGGSADLGPSNKTLLTYPGAGDFQPENRGGKNLHFGIREHAMAAALNGLALSKLRPYGATFSIFSDYARPGIRLSALMELPTLFVFTHDAMGDGEDGPTHQPGRSPSTWRPTEPGISGTRSYRMSVPDSSTGTGSTDRSSRSMACGSTRPGSSSIPTPGAWSSRPDTNGALGSGAPTVGRWSEWNGKFRDDVRDFFRGAPGSVHRVAERVFGSPEMYGHLQREAEQSVNFITCHDGFTLNDLVSYERKHNEANGEGNRDGSDDNRSWNCGVEGPTDDPAIERLRNRQARNLLGATILSVGMPMMLMGDDNHRFMG